MKMNALAMTSMNEYCTNAFSQPQNSHSIVGTMKNGTNNGPTRPHTALAIMLNDTTNNSANCASPITISIVQYRRLASSDQASGCCIAFQSVLRFCWASCTDRAPRKPAKYDAWSVIRLENDVPKPGIGDS